jgi:hypothetical protein
MAGLRVGRMHDTREEGSDLGRGQSSFFSIDDKA